jgi:hypothetical protein
MGSIGTRFVGEITLPGGHSIQTKFFVFGFAIIPLRSYYVMSEKKGRLFSESINGVPIPMHGRSVLMGFLDGPASLLLLFGLALLCLGPGALQRVIGWAGRWRSCW